MKSFKQFLFEQGISNPHEDQELNLMLHDNKPAAFVTADQFEAFGPHIRSGRFVSAIIPHPVMPTQKMHFVGQTEDHLNRAITAFRELWKHRGTDREYDAHEEFGRALGYSEKNIKNFVSTLRDKRNKV